jgi:hypothetical protein
LGNFFDGASQSTVFTGGGQVGANYQLNYWLVVGVEADFNWLTDHNNKSNAVFIPSVGNIQVAADSRWITMQAMHATNELSSTGRSHAEVPTSNWPCFANVRLLLRSRLPRPNPNAMPANKTGRSSIWIRCRQTARP